MRQHEPPGGGNRPPGGGCRLLLTAFGPYGRWSSNASALCLGEVLRDPPPDLQIAARVYPVDFRETRRLLEADLASGFDFSLHLGQAPGRPQICLEAMALNVGGEPGTPAEDFGPLVEGGPLAYSCALPLAEWSRLVQAQDVACTVSYHAGTYLCNATLYWACHLAQTRGLATRTAFVHLPLEDAQATGESRAQPTMPRQKTAAAVRLILQAMSERAPSRQGHACRAQARP